MHTSKAPSNKILILSAICLSIIASLGAYKIGEARKTLNEEKKKGSAVYVDIKKSNADNDLLEAALANIQGNSTLNASGSDENPFAAKPNDTLTDSFAKSIFLSYAERESGMSNDDDETIANDIIGKIDVSSLPKPAFSLSNINLFVPISTQDIKKYGNEAGAVIKVGYVRLGSPEYADNDLAKIAELHKSIGQKLIKVRVPSALSQSHLNLANAYVMFGDSLEILATQQQIDPLKALLAVRTAEEASKNITASSEEINTYLNQNDILYSDNEPGLIWPRMVVSEQ